MITYLLLPETSSHLASLMPMRAIHLSARVSLLLVNLKRYYPK